HQRRPQVTGSVTRRKGDPTMKAMTSLHKVGLVTTALLTAVGVLFSTGATPTLAVQKAKLPDGTTCERVATGFEECTTPDGTVYWCDASGECEKAPLLVRPPGELTGVPAITAPPGLVSGNGTALPGTPGTG